MKIYRPTSFSSAISFRLRGERLLFSARKKVTKKRARGPPNKPPATQCSAPPLTPANTLKKVGRKDSYFEIFTDTTRKCGKESF